MSARREGVRYGRMISGIDAAISSISNQSGSALDLLSSEDRELLHDVLDKLRGISQRAWSKI